MRIPVFLGTPCTLSNGLSLYLVSWQKAKKDSKNLNVGVISKYFATGIMKDPVECLPMVVVSVGEGQGTERVDMWSGWPPVLVVSNFRLCGQGASWRGKWHFRGTSAWQKLFPQRWFVQAGNLLGRFYCLQVANEQMYTVTANLLINRYRWH